MFQKSKIVIFTVFLILIFSCIYIDYRYGIFELREEQKVELPRVTIFYEGTNETTREGASDLE